MVCLGWRWHRRCRGKKSLRAAFLQQVCTSGCVPSPALPSDYLGFVQGAAPGVGSLQPPWVHGVPPSHPTMSRRQPRSQARCQAGAARPGAALAAPRGAGESIFISSPI